MLKSFYEQKINSFWLVHIIQGYIGTFDYQVQTNNTLLLKNK